MSDAIKTKASACPGCQAPIDYATGITGDGGPSEGDFSICVRCGQPLRYRADSTVYGVTLEEAKSKLGSYWERFELARKIILMRRKI